MKEEEKKNTKKKSTAKKSTTTKKTTTSTKKKTTVKKKDLPKKASNKNAAAKNTTKKTVKANQKPKSSTSTKKKTTVKKKELPKVKVEEKKELPKTKKEKKNELPKTKEEVKNNKKLIKEIIPTEAKKEYSEEDTRTYKILSYIGVLWILGMFVPCKDDKSLKFHVGQGIILNICEFLLSISVSLINNLIIDNVFKTQVSFYGIETGVYKTSALGLTISGILNLLVAAFTISYVVIGVLNASNDKDKKLPVIGKFSFYK